MPNYRRYRIPGGCYFFTVNLLERNNTLLVDRIDLLRTSVRTTQQRYPFHIDAWVVLPEHMHGIPLALKNTPFIARIFSPMASL